MVDIFTDGIKSGKNDCVLGFIAVNEYGNKMFEFAEKKPRKVEDDERFKLAAIVTALGKAYNAKYENVTIHTNVVFEGNKPLQEYIDNYGAKLKHVDPNHKNAWMDELKTLLKSKV